MTEDHISRMALCEQNAVILYPGRLYKFGVVTGCYKCYTIAKTLGIKHYGQHVQGCISCYNFTEENK